MVLGRIRRQRHRALYCHPYALFSVAIQVAFLLGCVVARVVRGARRRAGSLALRSLPCAAIIGVAFLPGLTLLRHQQKRVERDYWIRALGAEALASTAVQFAVPVYADRNPEPYLLASAVAAVFAGAASAIVRRARYGDVFVLISAVGPMALAAVASWKTPIWEARYFRFAHLFVLLLLVMAIWKFTHRAAWRRAGLVAAFTSMLAASDAAFWLLREIPGRPGMGGAIREIVAEHRRGEMLVAESVHHYFPAKYYAPPHVTVRLLDSASREFWGGHLIEPSDLISQAELAKALPEGVWFISHKPFGERDAYQSHPVLCDAAVTRQFAIEYDFGSPQWTVYVARCTSP